MLIFSALFVLIVATPLALADKDHERDSYRPDRHVRRGSNDPWWRHDDTAWDRWWKERRDRLMRDGAPWKWPRRNRRDHDRDGHRRGNPDLGRERPSKKPRDNVPSVPGIHPPIFNDRDLIDEEKDLYTQTTIYKPTAAKPSSSIVYIPSSSVKYTPSTSTVYIPSSSVNYTTLPSSFSPSIYYPTSSTPTRTYLPGTSTKSTAHYDRTVTISEAESTTIVYATRNRMRGLENSSSVQSIGISFWLSIAFVLLGMALLI